MKEFEMYTVATSRFYSASKMHISSNGLVATVGEIASSLNIKYLCLFPPATFLPFRVPSLLSLRKSWGYRIVFLCYSVK